MIDLALRRQFFADEIDAVANLRTARLRDALASVPREQFLRPGPWTVYGEYSGARQTADADPAHVYHNYSVAIDPARQLFNGMPSFVTGVIDQLGLAEGSRVLHVGAGLGYYTALIAAVVGATGHVVATEIDPQLAHEAAANLAAMPWVAMHASDSTRHLTGPFDAILVNAGVTHPQEAWLDALADHGRLVLPLTAAIAAMGPISKGAMVMITRHGQDYAARVLTFTAIFSGLALRDDALNDQLGKALMRLPFPPLKRLRRDPHDRTDACWLHGDRFCFSMA